MAVLTWICHSERALEVDELCYALAVEIGETDFDPENVPLIGTLLNCCQGLISVDEEASTIRLIHYTVQEYLCSVPGLFSKPHSILAETCLTYLNSQHIKSLTRYSLPPLQSMPFLKYSARYWGTHTNKDLTNNARTLALKLLNHYGDHVSAVSLLEQVTSPEFIKGIAISPLFSALHYASFFGIVELVTVLINSEDYEVDQQDCTGRTPLAWGARNGHEGVVKVFLEREDVEHNCPDKSGGTPLSLAAFGGHEGVVSILLERENVDPNIPDNSGNGPLSWAAIKGHEGVVKLLLGLENVDPNRENSQDRTPLGCAAIEGHEGVVKLLLERENVDPNRPDKNGGTSLWLAAFGGHEGVVSILLEQENVDPNHPDNHGNGPLSIAAIKGHEGVVKLLLGLENVDPNRENNQDRTPLGCAAIEGYEGVVKLLLERENIDPNRLDKFDRTPLRWAAICGHEGVVKLLLERGDVNSNLPHKQGGTALSSAFREGPGVVRLLEARISAETLGAGARSDRRWDAWKSLPPFFWEKTNLIR